MKEILAWGEEFDARLERLGIEAQRMYTGTGTVPSVYELSDEALETLCDDAPETWEDKDAAWWAADGCNLDRTNPQRGWFMVNGRFMKSWRTAKDQPQQRFDSLMQYIMYALDATQPRNVAAIVAGLADMNRCSFGELFTRYQPVAVADAQAEGS